MLNHIYGRLYLANAASVERLGSWDGSILCLSENEWPNRKRLMAMPVAGREFLSHDSLRKGTRFIHSEIKRGNKVAIYSEANSDAGVFAMSYLIEYLQMSLANAYTLVAYRMYIPSPSRQWLATAIEAYELPYDQEDLRGEGFYSALLSESDDAINHIYNGVHISNIGALHDQQMAHDCDIQAVLRMDNIKVGQKWGPEFALLHLPISDGMQVEPEHFSRATKFISEQIHGGKNVLVHCQAGISRSSTMVLAYLIEHERMSLPEAYALVVRHRPVASPHPALIRSLIDRYKLPFHPDDMSTGFLESTVHQYE